MSPAQDHAGERVVDVAAGEIGAPALRLRLIDQVVDLVPAAFDAARPFFATGALADPILPESRHRSSAETA